MTKLSEKVVIQKMKACSSGSGGYWQSGAGDRALGQPDCPRAAVSKALCQSCCYASPSLVSSWPLTHHNAEHAKHASHALRRCGEELGSSQDVEQAYEHPEGACAGGRYIYIYIFRGGLLH